MPYLGSCSAVLAHVVLASGGTKCPAHPLATGGDEQHWGVECKATMLSDHMNHTSASNELRSKIEWSGKGEQVERARQRGPDSRGDPNMHAVLVVVQCCYCNCSSHYGHSGCK